MLNFCDFIQVYVFSTNHHLKDVFFLLFQKHPKIKNLDPACKTDPDFWDCFGREMTIS